MVRRKDTIMGKISLKVLDKMIENHCTNAEIDFILYLGNLVDDIGSIQGIYYKDVMDELSISDQTFYNLKQSLVEKGIISAKKLIRNCLNYNDWNIMLLDNDFSNKIFYSNGYINLHHTIFSSEEFKVLKANEKLLILYLLKITETSKHAFRMKKNNFFSKFSELFGVTRRVIRSYVNSLKTFFSIKLKLGMYSFEPLESTKKTVRQIDQIAINKHNLEAIFRRLRMNKGDKDTYQKKFQEVLLFLKQYTKRISIKQLCHAVFSSYLRLNEFAKDNVYKHNREINPRLIHKLLIEHYLS